MSHSSTEFGQLVSACLNEAEENLQHYQEIFRVLKVPLHLHDNECHLGRIYWFLKCIALKMVERGTCGVSSSVLPVLRTTLLKQMVEWGSCGVSSSDGGYSVVANPWFFLFCLIFGVLGEDNVMAWRIWLLKCLMFHFHIITCDICCFCN